MASTLSGAALEGAKKILEGILGFLRWIARLFGRKEHERNFNDLQEKLKNNPNASGEDVAQISKLAADQADKFAADLSRDKLIQALRMAGCQKPDDLAIVENGIKNEKADPTPAIKALVGHIKTIEGRLNGKTAELEALLGPQLKQKLGNVGAVPIETLRKVIEDNVRDGSRDGLLKLCDECGQLRGGDETLRSALMKSTENAWKQGIAVSAVSKEVDGVLDADQLQTLFDQLDQQNPEVAARREQQERARLANRHAASAAAPAVGRQQPAAPGAPVRARSLGTNPAAPSASGVPKSTSGAPVVAPGISAAAAMQLAGQIVQSARESSVQPAATPTSVAPAGQKSTQMPSGSDLMGALMASRRAASGLSAEQLAAKDQAAVVITTQKADAALAAVGMPPASTNLSPRERMKALQAAQQASSNPPGDDDGEPPPMYDLDLPRPPAP